MFYVYTSNYKHYKQCVCVCVWHQKYNTTHNKRQNCCAYLVLKVHYFVLVSNIFHNTTLAQCCANTFIPYTYMRTIYVSQLAYVLLVGCEAALQKKKKNNKHIHMKYKTFVIYSHLNWFACGAFAFVCYLMARLQSQPKYETTRPQFYIFVGVYAYDSIIHFLSFIDKMSEKMVKYLMI